MAGVDRSEVEAGETTGTEGASEEVEVQEQNEQGASTEEGGDNQEGGEGKAKGAEDKATDKAKVDESEEPRETAARLALRQRALTLDQREKELAAREAKAKLGDADAAELAEFRQVRKNAKDDPIGYMEAGGLTPEDIFKAAKSGRAPMDPAMRKALAEVEALKKKDADREEADKKSKAEAAQRERDAKVSEGLTQFVKANAKKYELTAAKGAKGVKALQETAVAYYQKHGRMPSLEQLAGVVERAYEEDFKSVAGTERGKALLLPPKKTPAAKGDEGERKGVTNDLDSTPSVPPPKGREKANLRQSISEETKSLWEEVVKERKAAEEASGRG